MNAKILVVDDEQDFVELISFNLREHGFEVLAASNGLGALFKVQRFLPDLIVLDVMMEGIDGFSVCEVIRRQPATKTIPIIMVTAATGQIARLNGLACGANEFMTKPFSPRELVRRAEAILQQRAGRTQGELAAGQSAPGS